MPVTLTPGTPVNSLNATTLAVPLPASLADGDWVLLIFSVNAGTPVITAPSGWTTLVPMTVTASSTAGAGAIFAKKWVSGDSNPSVGTGGRSAAICIRVRGADPTTLLDVSPVITNPGSTSTSLVAPAITPTTAGTAVVHSFFGRTSSNAATISFTTPTGETDTGYAPGVTTSTNTSNQTFYRTDIASGASSGTSTTTASLTASSLSISYAIKAAPTVKQGSVTGSWSADTTVSGKKDQKGTATADWSVTGAPAGNSFPKKTSFEVGPSGTAIPTTGANGGDNFTATGVTTTGTTFVSDSSVPAAVAGGTYAAKLTTGATANVPDWRGWTVAPTGVLSFRMYVYMTAYPAAGTTLVALWQGGAQRYRVVLGTNGTFTHANASAFSSSSSAAIPLNTLARIEGRWDLTAGTFICDIYSGHSATPLAGGMGLTGLTFATSTVDEVRMGLPQGQPANFTMWTDEWAVSNSSTRPGPVVTGKIGTATGDWSVSTTVAGKKTPKGSVTANWSADTTVAGTKTPRGSIVGSWAASTTVVGKKTQKGPATGSWSVTTTVVGKEPAGGSVTGSWSVTGTPSGTKPVYPLAETVTSTFDASTGWTLTTGATVTGGELVLAQSTSYPRATKDGRFNLLGSHFGGELTRRASATTGTPATIVRALIDSSNTIEMTISPTGGVGCRLRVAGVFNDQFYGMIANATHYRIRVTSDRIIYFEALVRDKWLIARAVAVPSAWVDLSAVQLQLMAGTDSASDTGPVSAKFGSAGLYTVGPFTPNTAIDWGVVPTTSSSPALNSEIDSVTTRAARAPHIENWYRSWINTITTAQLETVRARGMVSLLTWEAWDWTNNPAYALSNIIAGNFDSYIQTTAQTMASWGHLIYLRPLHEFNHPSAYPWCVGVHGNTKQQVIDAWQHIVTIFRNAGATNVKFVWCPNQINGVGTLTGTYPGDSWVDVVGADAYNFGTTGFTWTWPAQVFDGTLNEIRSLTTAKPVWIGETASATEGGDKALWIKQLKDWTSVTPDLDALVYFDTTKEKRWQFDDLGGATADPTEFRALVASLDAAPAEIPSGSVTGSWSVGTTVAGAKTPKGSATGSWSISTTVSGKKTQAGSAAGSWSVAGAVAGKRASRGSATGSWSADVSFPSGRGLGQGPLGHMPLGGVNLPNKGSVTGSWTATATIEGRKGIPVLGQVTVAISGAFVTDGVTSGAFQTDGAGTALFDSDGFIAGAFESIGIVVTGEFISDGVIPGIFDSDGVAPGAFTSDGIGVGSFADQ